MTSQDLIFKKSDVEEILANHIVGDIFVMYNGQGPGDENGIEYKKSFVLANKLLVHKAFFIPTGIIPSVPSDIYYSTQVKDQPLFNEITKSIQDIDGIVSKVFNTTSKKIAELNSSSPENLKKSLSFSSYAFRLNLLIEFFDLKEQDVLFLLFHIIKGSLSYWNPPKEKVTKKQEVVATT